MATPISLLFFFLMMTPISHLFSFKSRGVISRDLPRFPSLKTVRFSIHGNCDSEIPGRESLPNPLPSVQFVTPDSLDFDPMRTMWDNVLIEGRESEVINAMKVLEDDIESIHFLTSEPSRARSGRAGVLLGFRGGGRRIPLGSHGDGLRRLLALSLSLIRTEQGILLVDEVDTGLHWTVMEEMWRLVVETARRSSVQVFATTHSYDCIRGLASLVESRPDLAGDVSIQKIERSLKEAVRFDAADVLAAVEQNVELR